MTMKSALELAKDALSDLVQEKNDHLADIIFDIVSNNGGEVGTNEGDDLVNEIYEEIETRLRKAADAAQKEITFIVDRVEDMEGVEDIDEILDQCYMIDEAITELKNMIFRKIQD